MADIDKMQVSPKRNLLCDTDAVSTRLTPYDPQCEQKLFCLVSFITVWRSLPHSSVQVAEWQSGRTDHVCVKMQQLSLFFSLSFSHLPPSFCSRVPCSDRSLCICLWTLFKGCRLANRKMPSHLYPYMSHESWSSHNPFICTIFGGKCTRMYTHWWEHKVYY